MIQIELNENEYDLIVEVLKESSSSLVERCISLLSNRAHRKHSDIQTVDDTWDFDSCYTR